MSFQAPRLFSSIQKLGLDLGSDRFRISTQENGVIIDEPAVIAIEESTGKVVGIGNEAAAMKDRVGTQFKIYHIISQGEIYDLEMAETFLRLFYERVVGKTLFFHPTVVAAVPAGSSDVAVQLLTQAIRSAGAREVFTIEAPLAAGIGAGVPVSDASGTFVLHMGHTFSEAAVLSLGSVVYHNSAQVGGERLLRGIQQVLRTNRSLSVSLETARLLLTCIGSCNPEISRKKLTPGKDVVSEHPAERNIASEDIFSAIEPVVESIENTIKELLSLIPATLTTDVIDKGLLITGGLAQLHGLEEHLTNTLGMPVSVVDTPDLVVAKGLSTIVTHLSEYRRSIAYQIAGYSSSRRSE